MADFFDDIPEAEAEVVFETEFSLPDPELVEEDHLTKFTREWNLKLEQKRQAEMEKEVLVKTAAEEERANWTTQRDIRLKAKKESNRNEELVVKEQLESEVDNTKVWDRVSKLIDVGEGVELKGSDTTRMHKLFIQLKNEPLESTRAE